MVTVPQISVEMCVSGRDLTEPKLSPDGTTVAFVVRWAGEAAIVTVPVDGGAERLVTTTPAPAPGRGLGGGCFSWVPDGSAIVYTGRDGQLWWQPMPGGPPQQITALEDGRCAEAPCVTADGGAVVATVDQAEVWLWGLDGGAPRESRRLDDGSADFVFDPYATPCGSTVLWSAWNVPDMPWDAARVEHLVLDSGERGSFTGPAAIHQPRTMPDGRALCVRDDTGWLNVWLDDRPLVDEPFEHAGPSWGQGQRSFAVSTDGAHVAFNRNEAGFGRLCVVEVATGAVSEVARGVHGQLSWVGERLVAVRAGARTPTQVVSYDTSSWQRTILAVGPIAGWEAFDLPEPELVEVEHGGAVIHARRYRSGQGRTLCWVHGGPTDQWQVDFRPRFAYWWSRGWDILVPDPRGSTGHGRAYQQALRGEWGRLDVDDTAAVLAASHAAGDSRPERTVVMGSSSGGLTVLGLLADHGHLVAGGVALYPVADLAALADASHRFESHYALSLVGPPGDARYIDRSPVNRVESIMAPLLLLHGDADPVVPISSSDLLAERLRAAGRDVEYAVYPDEGHGFRQPENRLDEFARTERFVGRVVAPR